MRQQQQQQQSRMVSRSPGITSHPQTSDDSAERCSRVEGRWLVAPGACRKTEFSPSRSPQWPSRPGTQDGSSPSASMATPQSAAPERSHSPSYPNTPGESLPSLRHMVPLPPLRSHLQAPAWQGVDMAPFPRLPRARDIGVIDPQLFGVEDEVSSSHGEIQPTRPSLDS